MVMHAVSMVRHAVSMLRPPELRLAIICANAP